MTLDHGSAWLFCPADRPERYSKAIDAADVVIIDLEDAVAPDQKSAARVALSEAIKKGVVDPSRVVVRINGDGLEHEFDLELVADLQIDRIMLAKTERTDTLDALAAHQVIALLETPLGVIRAEQIASHDAVTALMWGADDLVAGLGGTMSRWPSGRYRDVARHARSQVLLAAKAYDRLALDAVYMDIPDLDGLAEETADAVAVGFDVKVAIHPRQLPVIRDAFMPSDAEVERAKRLLETAKTERGVFTFEDQMVDGPVLRHAEAVLQRARNTATASI